MKKYAYDLHRKGELDKVGAMERLAIDMERKSNGGLGAAFLTGADLGADCFAMVANNSAYEKKSGYVLYDEEQGEAVFVADED